LGEDLARIIWKGRPDAQQKIQAWGSGGLPAGRQVLARLTMGEEVPGSQRAAALVGFKVCHS